MFTYRKDLMTILLVLLVSPIRVKAVSSDDARSSNYDADKEDLQEPVSLLPVKAVSSDDTGSSNYDADKEDFEEPAVSSDDTGSSNYDADKEDFDESDDFEICFEKIREECNNEYPLAIDFARIAIQKLRIGNLMKGDFLRDYYEEFDRYLDHKNILSPSEWCLENVEIKEKEKTSIAKLLIEWLETMLVSKDDTDDDIARKSTDEDEMIRCLDTLIIFGVTKKDSVHYAFYETTLDEDSYIFNNKDKGCSSNDKNIGCSTKDKDIGASFNDENIDYKFEYMQHVITNLILHGGMRSPYQFCIDYHNKLADARDKKKTLLDNLKNTFL